MWELLAPFYGREVQCLPMVTREQPGPESPSISRPSTPSPRGLSERRGSGLNFTGFKIDTGWIRYGCYENPARGADKGCPENVLHQVKHNPESSWEFHCCLGFRNCLFLFLGSDLSFLPLSLVISLLAPLSSPGSQSLAPHIHTRPRCTPLSKNTARSKKLYLLQVA